MSDLIIAGVLAHIIADWFFQNDWMARNKPSLLHPASWVHSGIHVLFMLFVFSPLIAFWIGVTHILIDSRRPLKWWRTVFRMTTTGDVALHVAIWQDQMAHVLIIAVAAWMAS